MRSKGCAGCHGSFDWNGGAPRLVSFPDWIGDVGTDPLRAAVLGRGVRLDERGARHGLGLAIAQDFVTASGGMLTLKEAPKQGLSVYLRWP